MVHLWLKHSGDLLYSLNLLLRAHIVEGLLEQVQIVGLVLVLEQILG